MDCVYLQWKRAVSGTFSYGTLTKLFGSKKDKYFGLKCPTIKRSKKTVYTVNAVWCYLGSILKVSLKIDNLESSVKWTTSFWLDAQSYSCWSEFSLLSRLYHFALNWSDRPGCQVHRTDAVVRRRFVWIVYFMKIFCSNENY